MASGHEIRITHAPGVVELVEVALVGEFDLATEAELTETVFRQHVCAGSDVRIDVTEASFMDAATVRLLVLVCAKVRSQGGSFTVKCRSEGVPRRAFEALNVAHHLAIEMVDVRPKAVHCSERVRATPRLRLLTRASPGRWLGPAQRFNPS